MEVTHLKIFLRRKKKVNINENNYFKLLPLTFSSRAEVLTKANNLNRSEAGFRMGKPKLKP